MSLQLEVPLYSANPGVDIEVEHVGRQMRRAIWDLFEADIYNEPEDVEYIFQSLLLDIALVNGWWQDADGRWFRPNCGAA